MGAQLRMLVWSEWRQRRTQLYVCLGCMVGGTAYELAYEFAHGFRTPVANFHEIASLFALFAPVFIAMRTALGETADGTKSFVEGLPISAQKRGWLRLGSGAAVLALPIFLSAMLVAVCLGLGWMQQAPVRPDVSWENGFQRVPDRASLDTVAALILLAKVTAILACSACSLYVWLAVLGTTLRAESLAGFAGAAFATCWFLGTALVPLCEETNYPTVATWIGAAVPASMVINYGYGEASGSYGDLAMSQSVFWPLVVNCLLQLGAGAWFVRRYSRGLSRRAVETPMHKTPRSWRRWSLPLPTQTLALTWLTLRQSLPMCLPGLVLAFLMAPFQLDAADFDPDLPLARRVVDVLPSSMWVVGLMWATVVGAGIFAAEFDQRIGEFWRTWPMPTRRLFAIKFIVGMAATLLVLDGATILATWNSSKWGDYHSMNWPYIACVVPLHAVMFSVAVAWACVLRRAVLGGMAAIVSFGVVMAALEWSSVTRGLSPVEVYNRLNNMGPIETHGSLDFSAHGFPVVATAMAVIIIASLLIGGRALSQYRPRFAN